MEPFALQTIAVIHPPHATSVGVNPAAPAAIGELAYIGVRCEDGEWSAEVGASEDGVI